MLLSESCCAHYKMKCYMLEIYQEQLNDLLLPPSKTAPPKLDIKKDAKVGLVQAEDGAS